MEIPLFKIHWDEEDIKAVEGKIRSGKYWCTGPEIEKFEKKICDYIGSKYCITFNSGGSALYGLMDAYDFGKDDEIIVPSFTFIATAYAPLYVNAKPVFADIEKETYGLDPKDVKEKITSKTKAIMPIHYGGMPCKIDELRKIADDNDLLLIEDAAESFGAKYKNKNVGTFGDSSIFSFCHNKIFTTSEGGCIVTDDKEVYEKAKLFRSYGRVIEGDYFTDISNLDYVEPGHNFRMSTINACLGISQLKKIDKIIKLRREKAEYMNKRINEIDGVEGFNPPSNDFYNVYQMYTIRMLDGKEKRDGLMKYLKEEGVSNKIYFDPVHKYTVFKERGYDDVDLPKTNRLSNEVLSLPIFPDLKEEEMDYIVRTIKEYFNQRD